MKTVAIFGGTFDPIHQGHLQSALALKQQLQFDELRLLPCHLPPHRELPGCSSVQRLAMVKLACEGTELIVDTREMHRPGPSYSVDTLEQIRAELGEQVSISWVMGTDAFNGLESWHRWRDLLGLAHLVVIARPGEALRETGAVAELLQQHRAASAEVLQREAQGHVVLLSLAPYPVSATQIRVAIQKQQALDGILPASVVNYIEQHQLYR